jgi:hypothetical protein
MFGSLTNFGASRVFSLVIAAGLFELLLIRARTHFNRAQNWHCFSSSWLPLDTGFMYLVWRRDGELYGHAAWPRDQ